MARSVDIYDDIPTTPPGVRKNGTRLEDVEPPRKICTYSKKTTRLGDVAKRAKDIQTRLQDRTGSNVTMTQNGIVDAAVANRTTAPSAATSSSAVKIAKRKAASGVPSRKKLRTTYPRKKMQEEPTANASFASNARFATPRSATDSEIIPKGARSKTTKYSSPTLRQQPAKDLEAPLHSKSTVQEIKEFLSKIGSTNSEQGLFLHPRPIGFSSSRERKVECLAESQQLDMFSSWMRQSKKGAAGRVGLFITWKDSPVGKTKEDFKKEVWHAWVAILIRRQLYIYDSNSDRLPKRKVTGNDLELHRQRALFTHLKNEHYHISDVWVGGEGNNSQDICMEVTSSWIQELMAGGLDINNFVFQFAFAILIPTF